MKKILLITILLSTLLVMSCKEPEINPLIGTWVCETENFIEIFQFTDIEIISTFEMLKPPISPVITNGTYEYYEKIIIFRMDNGNYFFADYSISGNKLTMTFSHNKNTVTFILKK